MSQGFDPSRSRESLHSMPEWIMKEITGNILEVPGVGKTTSKLLAANGITTTYCLLGKYLMLKEDDVGPVELADKFWYYLNSINTPLGYRSVIVLSVAEKLNIIFPGIYDSNAYIE
jgi:hypothetical protein